MQFKQSVKREDMPVLGVEEFEKDNDANYHIDFIHAAANLRASNYSLKPMDWITVKLKAGNIVPALATTTAVIAGLQTIELLKLLKHKDLKLDQFKNTFLNLAVPNMYLTEPGAPFSHEIKKGLKVDERQRWDIKVKESASLGQVVQALEKGYKLQARDVIYEATHLFFYSLRNPSLSIKKQPEMMKPIGKLMEEIIGENILSKQGYADLTITFVDPDAKSKEEESKEEKKEDEDEQQGEKILHNIPQVRIYLNKK